MNLLQTEPIAVSVALGTVVSSGIAVLTLLFPERLTPEVSAAIIVFANSLIALGVAIFARNRSTPVAAPKLPAGTTVTVTPVASPTNTTTTLPGG